VSVQHIALSGLGVQPPRPLSETTPSVNELSISGEGDLVDKFVSAARSHNVKALISVGGVSYQAQCSFDRLLNDIYVKWTGSRFFSTAVGSPANRTAFVRTITNFAQEHNLDGIDFE
jgi:chitinase